MAASWASATTTGPSSGTATRRARIDQDAGAAPDPLNHVDAHLDWHPEHGDRGSVLAATGEGMDPAEIARLLSACELTDAEMEAGFAGLTDPFKLEPAPN